MAVDPSVTSQLGAAGLGAAQLGQAEEFEETEVGTGDVKVTLVAIEVIGTLKRGKATMNRAIPKDIGSFSY